ncbi:MAG: hypothetical protein M5U28_30735 [Sandaracinaceae bacterium]|nr:hypothetical protein [Sandaracinaceae bacterium]
MVRPAARAVASAANEATLCPMTSGASFRASRTFSASASFRIGS